MNGKYYPCDYIDTNSITLYDLEIDNTNISLYRTDGYPFVFYLNCLWRACKTY